MNCSKFKTLLTRYIDKEINKNEKSLFKKHIEMCKNCQDEYDTQVQIKQLIRKKKRLIATEIDAQNIIIKAKKRSIEKKDKKNKINSIILNRFVPSFSIAAAVILLFLSFSLFKTDPFMQVEEYILADLSFEEISNLENDINLFSDILNE